MPWHTYINVARVNAEVELTRAQQNSAQARTRSDILWVWRLEHVNMNERWRRWYDLFPKQYALGIAHMPWV